MRKAIGKAMIISALGFFSFHVWFQWGLDTPIQYSVVWALFCGAILIVGVFIADSGSNRTSHKQLQETTDTRPELVPQPEKHKETHAYEKP